MKESDDTKVRLVGTIAIFGWFSAALILLASAGLIVVVGKWSPTLGTWGWLLFLVLGWAPGALLLGFVTCRLFRILGK